jgi:DNA-binding LacI/PurR family transcriptional regulator
MAAGAVTVKARDELNNAPHVSKAKRDAVRQAVRDLGYVPNPTARALATRQVGAVVLAVSGDDPSLFADPFFASVVVGVNAVLEETELELMLLLATSARGQSRLEQILRSRQADEMMLMSLHGDDPLADLDAVFVANDKMAVAALRVLREHGKSVPEDVAVVGFDDLAMAPHTVPPLTTVHQPIQALGREMARMLLALIAAAYHAIDKICLTLVGWAAMVMR